MATLAEEDFDHQVAAPFFDAVVEQNADAEYLYRNYLATLMLQPIVGTIPHESFGTPAVSAPAACFTLANIECPDNIYMPPVWPETLMSLVKWEYPGNKFRNNAGLKRRAFMGAAVQMMMFHEFAEQNDNKPLPPIRPDWHGYNSVIWAASYPVFKDILPPPVSAAFAAGLKQVGERILGWGIRGESCENDLLAPLGLAYVSAALNDSQFTAKVVAYAQPIFTSPTYHSPAGYWVERGGLDLGFAGTANFYGAWLALMTDWPYAKEALNANYRLRNHLILPEPDGTLSGPSHFNSRLGGAAWRDQHHWDGARDAAAAMITDEAATFRRLPDAKALAAAPQRRAAMFNAHITALRRIRVAEPDPVTGSTIREVVPTFENSRSHWSLRIWPVWDLPHTLNPAFEFYRPGFYAHCRELEANRSPALVSPFLRGETFVRNFNNEFIVARSANFATIIHAGPVGDQWADDGKTQFKGPLGFGGGQISAFWTPESGALLLGMRSGMTYDKSLDRLAEWRSWPHNTICGLTEQGVVFTSGRIVKPAVKVTTQKGTTVIDTVGRVARALTGQEATLSGDIDCERRFTIDEQGVAVTSHLRGDGRDKFRELYEMIPIYFGDRQTQPDAKPPRIEWRATGQWREAEDKFTDNIAALRITRFNGTITITFTTPQRVSLASEIWRDSFLSRAAARNILIDLRDTDSMSKPAGVGYRIAVALNDSPKASGEHK